MVRVACCSQIRQRRVKSVNNSSQVLVHIVLLLPVKIVVGAEQGHGHASDSTSTRRRTKHSVDARLGMR